MDGTRPRDFLWILGLLCRTRAGRSHRRATHSLAADFGYKLYQVITALFLRVFCLVCVVLLLCKPRGRFEVLTTTEIHSHMRPNLILSECASSAIYLARKQPQTKLKSEWVKTLFLDFFWSLLEVLEALAVSRVLYWVPRATRSSEDGGTLFAADACHSKWARPWRRHSASAVYKRPKLFRNQMKRSKHSNTILPFCTLADDVVLCIYLLKY